MANSQKFHCKSTFTTPNGRGYVRHGHNSHEICLSLLELEAVVRTDRERHSKTRRGIQYGEVTVFQGLGDDNVVGIFTLYADGRLRRTGTEVAA
jgi:hypothetical protein